VRSWLVACVASSEDVAGMAPGERVGLCPVVVAVNGRHPKIERGADFQPRRVIAGICRTCLGFGKVDAEDFDETGHRRTCVACLGSGDEYGVLLALAYQAGREDQLVLMRQTKDCLDKAVEYGESSINLDALRHRIGA
jgi:hypothetical protein